MKKLFAKLNEKISHHNLFAGIVIGVGVGLFIFSFTDLDGSWVEKKRMFHDDSKMGYFSMKYNGDMPKMMSHSNVMFKSSMVGKMIGEIASEEQFLLEMILHHRGAVTMAEQVLKLNPSEKIKSLAEEIISSQEKEITDMKSWLSE